MREHVLRSDPAVSRLQPMPATFREILDALEFVSMDGDGGDHQAFLCRQTGKIYWRSESSDLEELNDKLPDDIDVMRNMSRSPINGSSAWASPWCWTLCANFCQTTSIRFDICSAREALTKNSESC